MIPEKIQYITRTSRLSAGSFKNGQQNSYTIHSTANLKSTAQNERNNLQNNEGSASFHSVVDDKEVIRCIPFTHRAWHAGDGTKSNGGNMTSLSIEICESGDREKTLQNAIEVVAYDLKQLGWGVEKLRQHYDWTGKNCPRILRDTGRWNWFVESIKQILENNKEEDNMDKMIYNYIDENMPEWARESVQWAVDNKILAGNGEGLNLDDKDLKVICWMHRMYQLIK